MDSDHIEYEFIISENNEDYYCAFRYSELFVIYCQLKVTQTITQGSEDGRNRVPIQKVPQYFYSTRETGQRTPTPTQDLFWRSCQKY